MSVAPGITLALDAATYEGTVAVLRDGAVVAERSVAMRGEHAERLMPAVHSAMSEAGAALGDVARVICGEGPGSFTSLRIAGSIAKGIAFGTGVPLFAVSSLALVLAGTAGLGAGRYLVVLDAMRGERYTMPALIGPAGDLRLPEEIEGDPTNIVRRVQVPIALADLDSWSAKGGFTRIGPLEELRASPHARGVAPLLTAILGAGPVSVDSWEPTYGRLAEAQVKWEAAHGRALGA